MLHLEAIDGGSSVDNVTNDRPPIEQRTALAVTSLLLGIISILTIGLLGIPGIVTGAIALKKAKSNPTRYGGKSFAKAGIVTSSLSLLLTVIIAPLMVHFCGAAGES